MDGAGQMTMMQQLSDQSEVELLVYKLCGGQRSEEAMLAYTGYRRRQEIPAGQLQGLLRELRGEWRCRQILGPEAYDGSRSIWGKIALYQTVIDKAARTLTRCEGAREVSWAAFRRMIAAEMGKLPDREEAVRQAYALGAGELDETGYRWGEAATDG